MDCINWIDTYRILVNLYETPDNHIKRDYHILDNTKNKR